MTTLKTTRADYHVAGEFVDIAGAGGRFLRQPDSVRYRYGVGKNTFCPVCERDGAGVPWNGWFSCDMCGAIALVDTGEAFIRVRKSA